MIMSEEKRKDVPEIRKISDNVYINVSKIKSENVDLDGDSDEESKTQDGSKSPEEKSEDDRNKGDETIGIP